MVGIGCRFDTLLDLLNFEPLWNIIDSIATQDCPNATDAFYYFHVACVVFGSIMMVLAMLWLVSAQRLVGGFRGKVSPEQAITQSNPAAMPLASPA